MHVNKLTLNQNLPKETDRNKEKVDSKKKKKTSGWCVSSHRALGTQYQPDICLSASCHTVQRSPFQSCSTTWKEEPRWARKKKTTSDWRWIFCSKRQIFALYCLKMSENISTFKLTGLKLNIFFWHINVPFFPPKQLHLSFSFFPLYLKRRSLEMALWHLGSEGKLKLYLTRSPPTKLIRIFHLGHSGQIQLVKVFMRQLSRVYRTRQIHCWTKYWLEDQTMWNSGKCLKSWSSHAPTLEAKPKYSSFFWARIPSGVPHTRIKPQIWFLLSTGTRKWSSSSENSP